MRILIVSPGGELFGGGMGTVAKNIKDELEYLPSFSSKVIDSRGESGFLLSFFYLFRGLIQLFIEAISIKEEIVVHINVSERASFYRKFCFIALSRVFGIKVVLHHHGAEFTSFYDSCSVLSKRVVEYCICKSDCNIVLGNKWRDYISKNFEQHSPITVLYNAVPQVELLKEKHNQFNIAMIANLSDRKGVSIALEATKKLIDIDRNIEVNFIGGGEIDKFKKLASDLGVGQACQFHGWLSRSKTLDLLAASNILILPSYDEGLPMVILEAMAQSIPVICTPVGSIGEVFTDQKECLFMEVGSSASLFHNITLLKDNPALCDELTCNAYKLYKKQFSLEEYIKCLQKIYTSLC